jgi:hypothetical protein
MRKRAVEALVDVDLLLLRLVHVGVALHGADQLGDAAGGRRQGAEELVARE